MREIRPLVEQFTLGGRRLNLLAAGRVVNLAAAEGHPPAVMDISFALQALAAEELARRGASSRPACIRCRRGSTARWPRSSSPRSACGSTR